MRAVKEKIMTYSKELKKTLNYTSTGNGDLTYKSSLDNNLDLFYKAGGVRGNNYYGDKPSYDDYIKMFLKAFDEDPYLSIKNLFNIREFRVNGKGERDLYRSIMVEFSNRKPFLVSIFVNAGIIESIGRFDDLVDLYEKTKSNDVKTSIISHINEVMHKDLDNMSDNKPVTLLAKWLPTNTRNKKVYSVAKSLASDLGLTYSVYRKKVSSLRKYLNVLENNMTRKDYASIDYSKVPSRAFAKNTAAFYRNDEERIKEFFEKVENGEEVIKTSGITPNEVVSKVIDSVSRWSSAKLSKEELQALELTWSSLVDSVKDSGNTLVMADVSASMTGVPMSVSVALAILFAQSSTGEFHNMFMTFSGKPELIELSDSLSLSDNVKSVLESDWGYNTNIDGAFASILDTAIRSHSKQEELPERLVIVSDMQFDESGAAGSVHISRWKSLFKEQGYELPVVVYWNVSTSNGVPATSGEENVALVSGFTPATLDAVLTAKDVTPRAVMLEALNNPVYGFVEEIKNILSM